LDGECVIVSEQDVTDEAFGSNLAILLNQQVPQESIWTWIKCLYEHIEAKETFVLDSQRDVIYENSDWKEEYPLLRQLSTSICHETNEPSNITFLESPRFVTNVSAALLTYVSPPFLPFGIAS
jgi:hypothetical protein